MLLDNHVSSCLQKIKYAGKTPRKADKKYNRKMEPELRQSQRNPMKVFVSDQSLRFL
jgi:hypothetical protein